jgi:hypothetical protein
MDYIEELKKDTAQLYTILGELKEMKEAEEKFFNNFSLSREPSYNTPSLRRINSLYSSELGLLMSPDSTFDTVEGKDPKVPEGKKESENANDLNPKEIKRRRSLVLNTNANDLNPNGIKRRISLRISNEECKSKKSFGFSNAYSFVEK